jgi:hypothetical protein
LSTNLPVKKYCEKWDSNPRRPTPEDPLQKQIYKEYVWKPCDLRMENVENKRIDTDQLLKDFELFCKVDLQLADLSIKNHVREIKRFLKTTKLNLYTLTKADLRNYLSIYSERNPYVYKRCARAWRMGCICLPFDVCAHLISPTSCNMLSRLEVHRFSLHAYV